MPPWLDLSLLKNDMNKNTTHKKYKTHMPKLQDIAVEWHFVDAEGKVLGRLASEIAAYLIGKHKAVYTPHLNLGDKVVVTNAAKIAVTGNKRKGKIYHWHTGYPGGIKSESFEHLLQRKPSEVLRKAVKGMLPKNKLEKKRMCNLYIYSGSEHPHQAQQNAK
jgi:large subunit ribosomal protein L13